MIKWNISFAHFTLSNYNSIKLNEYELELP